MPYIDEREFYRLYHAIPQAEACDQMTAHRPALSSRRLSSSIMKPHADCGLIKPENRYRVLSVRPDEIGDIGASLLPRAALCLYVSIGECQDSTTVILLLLRTSDVAAVWYDWTALDMSW